jgi:hypothetical protein
VIAIQYLRCLLPSIRSRVHRILLPIYAFPKLLLENYRKKKTEEDLDHQILCRRRNSGN